MNQQGYGEHDKSNSVADDGAKLIIAGIDGTES